MYKIKADWFKRRYPEQDCFSAITTIGLDQLTVGTPCIGHIQPFKQFKKPSLDKNPFYNNPPFYNYPPPYRRPRPGDRDDRVVPGARARVDGRPDLARRNDAPIAVVHDSVEFADASVEEPEEDVEEEEEEGFNIEKYVMKKKLKTKKVEEEEVVNTTVAELYKLEDIQKANNILRSSVGRINVLFYFNCYPHEDTHYSHTFTPGQIYFNGKKALIYDDGLIIESDRLSDIHRKGEINNLAEVISESLKEHRYINYTFRNISTANTKYLLEDINTIFNSLKKTYKEHSTFYYSDPEMALRSLIDVVSISFYRLDDAIAIFDSKTSSGICSEIFLTSSSHTEKNIMEHGRTATYRFLFSTSKENLFTIDGERINRPFNEKVPKSLTYALNTIAREAPDDERLKAIKKRTASN